MPMPIRTITGNINDLAGSNIPNATFSLVPESFAFGSTTTDVVFGDQITVVADSLGNVSFPLHEGTYIGRISTTQGPKTFRLVVDSSGPWTLGRLIDSLDSFTNSFAAQIFDALDQIDSQVLTATTDATTATAQAGIATTQAGLASSAAASIVAENVLPLEFATRPALVTAIAGGLTPLAGVTYRAEGLAYIGQPGATAIGDLPGLVANGPWRMGHLGGVADGATNQSVIWTSLCAAVKAAGGGEIEIDAGTYLFETGQTLFTMDCNVKVVWHPKALFIGADGITTGLIRWSGASGTARGNYKWEFVNPRIDMSGGAFAGNQPSGIHVQNVREVQGNGGYFYGGAPWIGTPTTGGDSAVESVNVGDFAWNNGWFEGWRDAAFYPGGGNDSGLADDGVRTLVQGAYITGCVQGITFKRDGLLLAAIGNYIELCDIGITTSDVGLGQEVKTGQQMQVYNNTIRKSVGRAIGVRGQTVASIIGNVIEDWGYSRDGVTLGPAAPSFGRQAILCQGGRNSVISDNVFTMRDWVENDHVGILVTEYTDVEGTVWEAGGLSGGGNRFNVSKPIYESAAGNVFPSRLVNNRDTATLTITAMRNGSIYETTQPGNDAAVSWRGNTSKIGVRSLILREVFTAFQVGTLLSGIGSLAAGSTSAIQTISVPGALNTDAVSLNPNSSAGMNSRLNYALRAVTDGVQVQARNDHTAAVDFTAQSFTLAVSRRG